MLSIILKQTGSIHRAISSQNNILFRPSIACLSGVHTRSKNVGKYFFTQNAHNGNGITNIEPKNNELKEKLIKDWLIEIGFKKQADRYQQLFETQEYHTLKDLTLLPPNEQQLEKYGILAGKHRNQILSELKKLSLSQVFYENTEVNALWNTLQRGELKQKTDNVLILPDGIYWLTEKNSSLYVRIHNENLYDIIQKMLDGSPECGLVITGNPGIGKSWFINYCLYRFASEKKTVFVESVSQNKAWLFRPNLPVLLFDPASSVAFPNELDNPNTIYLFDPAGNKTAREPRQVKAFTVVTASPNNAHYQQFIKRVENRLYMPCWSEDEIVEISNYRPPHIKIEEVMQRYYKYGGIIRHIFAKNDEVYSRNLDSAINTFQPDLLYKTPAGLEVMPKASHCLFGYIVSSDYQNATLSFLSDEICTRVLSHIHKLKLVSALHFVLACSNDPKAETAALYGHIFEGIAHQILSRGGTFEYRELSTKKTTNLELPPVVFQEFDPTVKIPKDLPVGFYYKPTKKNQAVYDAFIKKDDGSYLILQMTVSDNHPISLPSLKQVMIEFGLKDSEKFILVFVLPKERFAKFNTQSYIGNQEQPCSAEDTTVIQKKVAKKKKQSISAEEVAKIKQQVSQCALLISITKHTSFGD